jgi:pimeloyl-ACP methyl ester carboxylesterase
LKKIKRFLRIFLIIIIVIIIIGLIFPTWTPKIKGKNSISELEKVNINGTKHEIMIRGLDVKNQIIIFVHGGPGCSEIPYVTKYQDLLEDYFTIVHYDQRGSGKSYDFFEDYSNLSSELLATDLVELTDYILKRFNKERVILAGHSYGTYIAMQAAVKSPEKYAAYLGIGQMSNIRESEIDSLSYCIQQAQDEGQNNEVLKLETLRSQIEDGSSLTPRYYVRKYGGASRLIDDNNDYIKGFLLNPEYNLFDIIRYLKGVSLSQKVLLNEAKKRNLPTFITSMEIPCYFIMGKFDYMTSAKSAKNYFNIIKAPDKEFILYQNSAHYPQFEEEGKFAEWLIQKYK